MRVKADDTIAGDGYFAGSGHIDGGFCGDWRPGSPRSATVRSCGATCRSPERCSARSPGVPERT